MSGFNLREEIGKMEMAEEQNCIGGTAILVDAVGFKRSYKVPLDDMRDNGQRFPSQLVFPIRERRQVYGENGYMIRLGDKQPEARFFRRIFRMENNERDGQNRPIYYEVIE